MKKSFATLQVRRYKLKNTIQHGSFPVVERVYLKLCPHQSTNTVARGLFTPISVVRKDDGKNHVLPVDRARAWEQLLDWIKYYLIFTDAEVQTHQYNNRVLWESWDSADGPRPDESQIYDWRNDSALLQRLVIKYKEITDKFAIIVGKPDYRGFDNLYPNKFGDLGLSDNARKAVRDLKLLFGDRILEDGDC